VFFIAVIIFVRYIRIVKTIMKGDNMKKILQYLGLPIVEVVLAPALIYLLFKIHINVALSIAQIVALIIYIFVAGFLFSKIKDKKIRIISALISVMLFIIVGIIVAIWSNNSDTGAWAGMFALPLTYSLNAFIASGSFISYILTVLLAPLPVLLSVGAGKVFIANKKPIKIIGSILIIAIIGISIVHTVQSLYQTFNGEYSYVGDDGQIYNAYYDVNGIKYEDNSDVPYYDVDGKKYMWTYDETIDTDDEENFLYCGELTDEKGNTYDLDNIYVNADGYIFIDKDEKIDIRDDLPEDAMTDWCYCDNNGNIYMSIIGVTYLSDGTPFTAMGQEYRTK